MEQAQNKQARDIIDVCGGGSRLSGGDARAAQMCSNPPVRWSIFTQIWSRHPCLAVPSPDLAEPNATVVEPLPKLANSSPSVRPKPGRTQPQFGRPRLSTTSLVENSSRARAVLKQRPSQPAPVGRGSRTYIRSAAACRTWQNTVQLHPRMEKQVPHLVNILLEGCFPARQPPEKYSGGRLTWSTSATNSAEPAAGVAKLWGEFEQTWAGWATCGASSNELGAGSTNSRVRLAWSGAGLAKCQVSSTDFGWARARVQGFRLNLGGLDCSTSLGAGSTRVGLGSTNVGWVRPISAAFGQA